MLLQSLDTLRCPTTVGQDELNVVFLLGTGPGPECQVSRTLRTQGPGPEF